MNSDQLKDIIGRRDPLLPAMIEFNLRPARYIHRSWIDHLIDAPLLLKLKAVPRAEKRLSSLILAEFNLHQDPIYDFEQHHRRAALLDTDALTRLVYLTGIALNAADIARVIEKKPLLALRNTIGEPAYLFALKKAPFLLGQLDPKFKRDGDQDYRSHAMNCGILCLQACYREEPAGLLRRLYFKFPKDTFTDAGSQPEGLDQAGAWRILRKVLIQEVKPEWAPFLN